MHKWLNEPFLNGGIFLSIFHSTTIPVAVTGEKSEWFVRKQMDLLNTSENNRLNVEWSKLDGKSAQLGREMAKERERKR